MPERRASHRGLLSRRPLGQQIAEQLRQEILLGRIPPGMPVSQDSLCELFGTSRMPARDALVRLTHEGLIVATPGGHSVVASMTRADVVDAFDISALAHGRAGRRAAQRVTDEDIDVLQRLHEDMLQNSDDPELLEDLNWAFHRHINRLSGSAKLLAMVRSTSLDIPKSYLSELPGWTTTVNNEHAAIVDALRNQDGHAVDRLLQEHLKSAGTHLADYLAERGRFTPGGELRASEQSDAALPPLLSLNGRGRRGR